MKFLLVLIVLLNIYILHECIGTRQALDSLRVQQDMLQLMTSRLYSTTTSLDYSFDGMKRRDPKLKEKNNG